MEFYEIQQLFNACIETGPIILFAGQSGGGKGTQKERIEPCIPGLLSIVMGDLFGEQIPTFSPYHQKKLSETQEAGKRQCYVHAVLMWAQKISVSHTGGPILIDGSPRSKEEAQIMIDFFVGYMQRRIIVFCFDIPDEEADRRMIHRNQQRLAKGEKERKDSNSPESRANKIAYYHTDVAPSIEYMKGTTGVSVHMIDGLLPENDIHKLIIETLARSHSGQVPI